ncbi:hypothetical protein DFP73DRAFT_636563 [Morchella snyderi]|nr:hypothetical protein DFP73DRAFT_636563 [Morchella snyderi]
MKYRIGASACSTASACIKYSTKGTPPPAVNRVRTNLMVDLFLGSVQLAANLALDWSNLQDFLEGKIRSLNIIRILNGRVLVNLDLVQPTEEVLQALDLVLTWCSIRCQ